METIIALLMFVGTEQKLIEMTYMPSISNALKKKGLALGIAMLPLCVLK